MSTLGRLEPLIAAAGLGLVVAFSTPAIKHVADGRKPSPARVLGDASSEPGTPGYLYEDDDGKATKESMKAYSDAYAGLGAWTSSAVGLGASIAATVILAGRSGVPESSLGALNLMIDTIAWVITTTFHGFPSPLALPSATFSLTLITYARTDSALGTVCESATQASISDKV
jgi:hypothetical protein